MVWDNGLRLGRVPADADGDFTDAEDVEHVELAGQEREVAAPFRRDQVDGECVAEFLADPLDPVRCRKHRVLNGEHLVHLLFPDAIEVQHLQAGTRQAFGDDPHKALVHGVAEFRIGIQLAAQADGVEADETAQLGRPRIPFPSGRARRSTTSP